MISIADSAASKILQLLTGPTGMNAAIYAMSQLTSASPQPLSARQFFANNVAPEISERSEEIKYTALYVYCDKIFNTLVEKCRTFSGHLQMVIEIRVSQDRLDGLEQNAHLYTASVTHSLDQFRGDWGQGLFFGGCYEVVFGPVKRGGRNFIKVTKVTFPVEASVS